MNVWFQMHKAPVIGYSLCSAILHCLLNLFPPQLYHRLIFASCSINSINYFFAGYLQGTIPQFFWVLIFLYAISIYSINHSSSHSMLWKMCHSNCWLTYTALVVSKLFWFHILINKMFLSLHPLYMCIYLVITLLLILLHICTIVLIYCVYY